MLRLVIEDGEGTTHVVPLVRDEISIGREEGNTIRLTERNVSRNHARLLRTGQDTSETVIVEDLDSYNGVRVNGASIAWKCTLRPTDTVQIGDYFLALERVEVEQARVHDTTQVSEVSLDDEATAPLEIEERGRLVVVSSNLAGTVYELNNREMVLGRTESDGNQVVVNHRSISRNHVKIIHRDQTFTVIDLGSANGVLVNGESVDTTTLVNGDILELGHVKLRFSAPGDNYVFHASDIDDVVLPPQDNIPRILVGVLGFIGLALLGYVMADIMDSEVETTEVSSGNRGQVVATGAGSNGQANKVDTTKLLSRARGALSSERWEEAESTFNQILRQDPMNQTASAGKYQAVSEQANRDKHDKIIEMLRDKRWLSALELIENFPPTSVYLERVNGKTKQAREAWLSERFRVGMQLVADGHPVAAEEIRNELAARPYGLESSKILGNEIAAARQAAKEARQARAAAEATARSRVAQRERDGASDAKRDRGAARNERRAQSKRVTGTEKKRSSRRSETTAPTSDSLGYAELIKNGQTSLIQGNRREAVQFFERALKERPRDLRAHQALCMNYEKLGRWKKALNHCKRAMKYQRNPGQRKQLQTYVDRIQKRLGQN